MITRQELSDAALHRLDATRRAKEAEQEMIAAHAQFQIKRDALAVALSAQRAAIAAHLDIERKLLEQEHTET